MYSSMSSSQRCIPIEAYNGSRQRELQLTEGVPRRLLLLKTSIPLLLLLLLACACYRSYYSRSATHDRRVTPIKRESTYHSSINSEPYLVSYKQRQREVRRGSHALCTPTTYQAGGGGSSISRGEQFTHRTDHDRPQAVLLQTI